MKSRFLSIIFLSLGFGLACSPDHDYNPEDFSNYTVDKVTCEASSSYLIADGVSELDLHVKIYTKVGTYTDKWNNQRDRYMEIPRDRWRNHNIRFFLENTEITTPYKTATVGSGELFFRAEVDGVKSSYSPAMLYAMYPLLENTVSQVTDEEPFPTLDDPYYFKVTVRPPFTMPARKIPVIFHVINHETNYENGQVVDVNSLYKVIDELNAVFGQHVGNSPNGVNTNLEFVPAIKNVSGAIMEQAGINLVRLSRSNYTTYSSNIYSYVQSNYLWDTSKYLNIWIIHATSTSTKESFSFSSLSRYLPTDYPASGVPPLSFPTELETMAATELRQHGIVIRDTELTNYRSNPVQMVGAFFGLIPNAARDDSSNFPHVSTSNDTKGWLDDQCADTPKYNKRYQGYASGGIENSATGSDYYKYTIEAPYYMFESTNIMDHNTHYSVITRDQAERIELVLQNAPRRQMWRDLTAITQ